MLFLDEPTSGLDAYAAMLLVDNVSRITKDRNLATLMTVHQPSWAMFTQLDRVILMAKGGVYYEGPPREAVPWFKSLGYDVPEGVNPADHFISIAEDEGSEGSKERVKHLLENWTEAKHESTSSLLSTPQDAGNIVDGAKAKGEPRQQYPTTAAKEFGILLTRWWWEQVSSSLIPSCCIIGVSPNRSSGSG
jgi:ABC-type multidrug transport system ATPase subunit